MKVFISACISFVLAVSLSVFSSLYARHAAAKTAETLSSLPSVTEDNENTPESAIGCIEKAKQSWNKKSRTLSFFISHRELDEIDTLLVTLRSSAESGDSGYYASTLAALTEKLEKLSSSESFSIVSIF